MTEDMAVQKYLPLSEATYYIMLMLVEPRHGYSVMQEVEALTEGKIQIGPGTLYGAFSTLEKDGMIDMVRKEDRRKVYALTALGQRVLRGQITRLGLMIRSAKQVMPVMNDGGVL